MVALIWIHLVIDLSAQKPGLVLGLCDGNATATYPYY